MKTLVERALDALNALSDPPSSEVMPARELKRQALYPVSGSAPCGDIACAGCYQVEPGKSIHPRKVGEAWLRWLELWKPKREERKQ